MTTNTTETLTRYEVEVDTEIAQAWSEYNKAVQLAHANRVSVERSKNQPRYIVERYESALINAELAVQQAHATYRASAERYGGWSRFYLVQNTNGHIHRSMDCSTCYRDTEFAWLPQLSGLTEADAVVEYGEILCSICFPSAPVEWTTGTNKKTAAEKELTKALREIERSPEGKKVKTAKELVSRKAYAIEQHERRLSLWAEYGEDAEVAPPWLPAEVAKAEVALPKLRKELARAEGKLADAIAALDAALAQ